MGEGNYNLCGDSTCRKSWWYIIMQPPALCRVHYKGTTWTPCMQARLLWSVTMGIKNFLSHVRNCLSSLISTCSPSPEHPCMTLNYKPPYSSCTSLNCQGLSSCMTLNCPPSGALMINHPLYCLMKQYHSSHAHGPHQQKSTFLIPSYSILLHLIPLILGVRRE